MTNRSKRSKAIPDKAILAAVFVTLLLGTMHCRSAQAAEAGVFPYKGVKDFYSGVLPAEPGLYVANDVVYYEGNINQTVLGGRIALGLKAWAVGYALVPTYVTSLKILGGTYAFNIGFPISGVYGSAELNTARANRSTDDFVFNIGDITITPLILGWNAEDFQWNIAMSVIAPTGEYQKGALAFTSLNYWTVLPQFALTYFDPASGWNISGAAAFEINTENHATDYLSGDDFDLDWSVAKQITQRFNIGLAGYYLQEVTGDSGPGAILGSNQASVWAFGPAVNYVAIFGHTPVNLLAKWTHEIQATRTFQGNTVTVAASLKF
jgi:hypothetical protein